MTLNSFFIIAILGPPTHRKATRGPRPAIGPVPAIIGSPRPVSSPSLSRVNRAYEKNREPRRAILRLATNRKSSRYKASTFFYPCLIPLSKPDVIFRVTFCLVALPRPRLFDHLRDSFMSPIIASLKQISDLARRPENRVRQRHFPFRYSMRYSLCRRLKKPRYCDISTRVL